MGELVSVIYVAKGTPPHKLGIHKLRENKLSSSHMEKVIWLKKLSYVVNILNEIDVEYVLIKYLNLPFARMQDIDLLVEDPNERKKLFRKLLDLNFIPFQSILPPHKDKLEFWLPRMNIQVDIYPIPSWWKIRFAPDHIITMTREKVKIGSCEVYVPNPTHDLLIMITHSYAHGVITIGELAHEVKLLMSRKVSWDVFVSLTKRYHLEHAILSHLVLLRSLIQVAKEYDILPESRTLYENFENITNIVDLFLSESVLNRKIAIIIINKALNSHFPILLPVSARMFSAFHELGFSVFKRYNLQSNELQTYVIFAIELIVGGGRATKRPKKWV